MVVFQKLLAAATDEDILVIQIIEDSLALASSIQYVGFLCIEFGIERWQVLQHIQAMVVCARLCNRLGTEWYLRSLATRSTVPISKFRALYQIQQSTLPLVAACQAKTPAASDELRGFKQKKVLTFLLSSPDLHRSYLGHRSKVPSQRPSTKDI